MKTKIVIVFLFCCSAIWAQSLNGLWQVEKVELAGQMMTPQAKWIHFKDSLFEGGNGLLQNGAGSYNWNAEQSKLSLNDTLGFEDPFEAFLVSFRENAMIWERKEEGQQLKVTLVKTATKPLRPRDGAVGIWMPEPEDSLAFLFLSWTGNYTEQYKDGRRFTGLWQAHPHREELTLVPWDRRQKPRRYKIETGPWNVLSLQLIDKPEQVLSFSRRRKFPD